MTVYRWVMVEQEKKEPTSLSDAAHPESWCHRCGGPNVVWFAPSPLWNAVMRGGSITGKDEFDGIVCPTCFAVLAEMRGVADGWMLNAEAVHATLELVTPSGREWDGRRWTDCIVDEYVEDGQISVRTSGCSITKGPEERRQW